ncbi:MAG: proteasome component M29 [Chaenotheca gracillima]|nr:MAG: proteasome component M29 [Chaenotheca gracillima]
MSGSSATTTSAEDKELNLVSKVELRFALADSDSKLQNLLKTYLAPILLKLGSPHATVRNKVISITHHINTRIKSPSLQLPVAALLKQFKDSSSSPLIRQFDLIYIQQGLGRLPSAERLELFPILIHGISHDAKISSLQGGNILNMLFRLLPQLPLPERGSQDDSVFREKLDLLDRPDDIDFLAAWLGKALLLAIDRRTTPDLRPTCPGLSPDDYEFLTLGRNSTWDPVAESGLNLTQTKICICKFLATGVFDEKSRFSPALIASADSNSNISSIGDDMIKRSLPNISLEDETLVETLFKMYFGDKNERISSVRPPLQTKIIGLLSKSIKATGFATEVSQLIRNGLVPSADDDSNQPNLPSGREALRLRGAVVSLTNWVARMGSSQDLRTIAPGIVHRLQDFVGYNGWPNPYEGNATSDASLRGSVYECIGLLAKTAPEELLLESDLDLLSWLFVSLSADSTENISVSIEEALGSALQAMAQSLDVKGEKSLRKLLYHNMRLDVGDTSRAPDGSKVRRSARFAAVRFANRCLPYGDSIARWIDLLAIGGKQDERNEVIEEGRKGLDPNWFQMLNPTPDGSLLGASQSKDKKYAFPNFSTLLSTFSFFSSPEALEFEQMEVESDNVPDTLRKTEPVLFSSAVSYCRRILLNELLAGTDSHIVVDTDWERKIDVVATTDETARTELSRRLRSLSSQDPSLFSSVSVYLKTCFEGILRNQGKIRDESGNYVVEICSLAGNSLISNIAPEAPKLKDSIFTNVHQTRVTASQALGILGSHEACPSADLNELAKDLMSKVQDWKPAIGAEVNKCHGSVLALGYLASRLHCRNRLGTIPEINLQAFINLSLNILVDSKDNLLQEAATSAIGQMSLFSAMKLSHIQSPHSIKSILEVLTKRAKAGNEKAIIALGNLSMIFPEESSEFGTLSDLFLEPMFALHELKQPEVHLAVGEALSCVALGWQSKSLMASLDIDTDLPQSCARTTTLEVTVDKILGFCKQSKPSLRKASCIWLLCQVQYCGHFPVIQQRLRLCQMAFKGFLADRDDLVQESAARGLTLVYEKGDKDLKIMSLASELGDPSLVYRFMSLASNNAIWSSRAAFGRFGLGNVLSESGYLAENPKLYPKLFRYRFDPNPNVQKSMNDIWNSLVKDSSATIDKYFVDIIEDLLKSILGKEWRVRQASCAAIADLVQGRVLEKYEAYLGQIWDVAFKVLDDIKDSVRTAAMSLCRVLTTMLVRSAEAGSFKKSDTMLENVMPFLMSTSGLEASAKDVQMFALDTILKLAKTGTKTLKPYVPSLVERLLGLLSTLEPEAVNYLHLNASKYNLTEEKIDAARLQSVRSSPMMDAIERCLDIMDEETMRELVPCLESALKQAVGMPSKVGCSRILVSLATRNNFLFRPHAGHFLKLVQRTIMDRNDTVSSSYATSMGYICRLATDAQLLQCNNFAKKLYFDSEDERHRVISGDVVNAIGKHATDKFSALAADFLPFVFLAKHDSHEHVQESFKNTWEENVGGSRAIILYQKEIIDLALPHLGSPSWVVKHASALSIGGVAKASVGQFNLQQQQSLWPALDQALAGKSWDGKEKVLEAFVVFAKDSAGLRVVLRESRRNNPGYRQHALLCLGDFVESCGDDMFQDVWETVEPIVDDFLTNDADMDVDSGGGGASSKTVQIMNVANGIRSCSKAIGHAADLTRASADLIDLILKTKSGTNRSIHSARFEAVSRVSQVLQAEPKNKKDGAVLAKGSSILERLVNSLGPLEVEGAPSDERLKRAEAAQELVKLFTSANASFDPNAARVLQQSLEAGRSSERDRGVQKILDSAGKELSSAIAKTSST